jgi:hypothetical protein
MNPNKQEIKKQNRNPKDDGVFSKRTQTRINLDHDYEVLLEGVCNDPKSLPPSKSNANSTHVTRTQSFSKIHKRKGREKLRT